MYIRPLPIRKPRGHSIGKDYTQGNPLSVGYLLEVTPPTLVVPYVIIYLENCCLTAENRVPTMTRFSWR
jgi:hypothetical protein